jgi:hypothetical protein
MALGKSRVRMEAKGPGRFEVRELEPTSATAFSDVGYVEQTAFNDDRTMQDMMDETGELINSVEQSRVVSGVTQMMQTGKDEFDLLSGATEKVHAIRHSGVTNASRFVYFGFDRAIINPSIPANYAVGKRLLPLQYKAVIDQNLGYVVPPYYRVHADAEIHVNGLQLWTDPRLDWNTATVKLLDMSGFGRHGTITPTADVATIWGQADILRFDGSDDYVDFGNVCNFAALVDFAIDFWLRVPAADGTAQEIFTKKASAGVAAGFSILRDASNKIAVELADGTDQPDIVSAANVLQNVWTHVLLAADRTGNAQLYINGAANGSAVDVSAVGDMTTATSLYAARFGTAYGQVDLGNLRVYNFGADGLPANIATIALNHYNAQKAIHGL